MSIQVLAGLAFLFSVGILLQLLACVLYSNWWPMIAVIVYPLVPCAFVGGGEDGTDFIRNGGGGGDWDDFAKFFTGMALVGSIAVPCILGHAGIVTVTAMWMSLGAFIVLFATLLLFQKSSFEEEW
eukprot:TRINITY_DN632_c0_g1_i4.p1 TRINITY_DN632_c0_g1~~TRINITY_DN632_c0_g1_i4.p1  ORF type:complete len:126 (-),score=20.39 TRINITY_DN632_c0_g1_i4:398-775(-)